MDIPENKRETPFTEREPPFPDGQEPFPQEVPGDSPGENTEPPEEFERIDEVREPAYPDGQPA